MPNVLATLEFCPLLLAQPDVSDGQTTATTEQGDASSSSEGDTSSTGGLFDSPMFMIIIIGMMVLWIFLLGGGSRKQKKKQAQMLASMSKGSKIVTIGGIKGSVVEVREDEVVVKVDENNNTRMKFSRDSIRTVVDSSAGQKVDKTDKSDKADKADKDS